MKKILLTIQYDGNSFEGWQVQPTKRTVQSTIQDALSKILNEKISLFASGRTDSGVHALAQTAHFESIGNKLIENFFERDKLNTTKLCNAINANLPTDVKILSAKEVKSTFHARFDVKQKIYLYRLELGSGSPLTCGHVGTCKYDLDLRKMKQGAKYLVGKHDFSSFCSSKTEVKDFVRTINYIKIKKANQEITFEVSGNGFLYNMVRIIVGTLIDVGSGKLLPKQIKTILENKDRKSSGKTAPACGLYLKKVVY